jgi:hypothetical protein
MIYKREEKLEASAQKQSAGMRIMMNSLWRWNFYKNSKEKSYTSG